MPKTGHIVTSHKRRSRAPARSQKNSSTAPLIPSITHYSLKARHKDLILRTSVLFVGIALSIASCVTVDYLEPTSGPRARVRFVTDLGGQTILYSYDDSDCSVNEKTLLNLVINPDPIIPIKNETKRLGLPLWDYKDFEAKELYVVANRQTNGLFYGSGQAVRWVYECIAPFRYSFQENRDYEVKFIWDPQNCRVTISELVKGENGFSKNEVAAFANTFNKTSSCLKKVRHPVTQN